VRLTRLILLPLLTRNNPLLSALWPLSLIRRGCSRTVRKCRDSSLTNLYCDRQVITPRPSGSRSLIKPH
jgi:hypothetical protein